MPSCKTTETELRSLFRIVREETNDFTCLPPVLIGENPRKIKVFRMLVGLGLTGMGRLLSRNFVTISNYELGKIKTIPLDEAEKMSSIILKNLPPIVDEELLVKNFDAFRTMSKGGISQALKRAETMALTKQENMVQSVLENRGTKFKAHVTLDTSVGPMNYDFLAGENVVIDCTSTRNKWKAESLGFRAVKLKEKHPDYKTIAVVPSNVDRGFLRRLVDFDFVLKENEISALATLV